MKYKTKPTQQVRDEEFGDEAGIQNKPNCQNGSCEGPYSSRRLRCASERREGAGGYAGVMMQNEANVKLGRLDLAARAQHRLDL
jgi:hypothetical protein